MGEKQFQLIEKILNTSLPKLFKSFMTKYAGLSIEEDCYRGTDDKLWIIASFDDFKSMYSLTREFKEKGWGFKVPFAYDEGGWHFCLSFDDASEGKIIVNRWTDHSPDDQFVIIADNFEIFIQGLQKRPEELR